jgi:hypothetical protein
LAALATTGFKTFLLASLRQKSVQNSSILAARRTPFAGLPADVFWEFEIVPKKQENTFCGKIECCQRRILWPTVPLRH